VTGYTLGSLGTQPGAGKDDAFVVRWSHEGVWSWTRVFGTSGEDNGLSVALGHNGNVLVTGQLISGNGNTASGPYATVSGGLNNTASSSSYATVGGGKENTASGFLATVGGGFGNTANSPSATVGGGYQNTASNPGATVGGGEGNTASGFLATVGGGFCNTASNPGATVGGGAANTASGETATVSGGYANTASGFGATVSGGRTNTASGQFSCVPGGVSATASHTGSFVYNGDEGEPTASFGDGTFTVRCEGGARFYTANGSVGAQLPATATAWDTLSDSNSKTDFEPIKPREILSKVAALPVKAWHYKHDRKRLYIGPMAQDFHAAFGLGSGDKTISTLDSDGVMYAAIQGLVEELKERDKVIGELKSELDAVKDRLDSLPPGP
jgi:hypothetical protein